MGGYRVKLYVSPDCEDCDRAKSFLQNRGIKFQEVDIRESGPREELRYSTGRTQCPTVDVGGRFYCGLNKIEKAGKIIAKQVNEINLG